MNKHIFALTLCCIATIGAADHELLDRDLENGQSLYTEHCAVCHGADLEGQPNWQTPDENGVLPAPPHDVTGHTWHHGNQLLFDYTKLGGAETLAARGISDFNSGMPGFDGTLTDGDIWDVLGYIRSTWPDEVRDIQASRNLPHD